ncbi:sulfotransferase [Nonomuraea sp. NPDC026600]|uniref:sulfotransferase n=1 Tax=Nonomuraea sp. NPDC026600 TaxID=3155363 RepID=UPI0033CADEA2
MMNVIGAGLPRTGTTSLKAALERLGFGPCHHMREMGAHPEQAQRWQQTLDGPTDWTGVLRGYRTAVDWPSAGQGWEPLCDFLGVAVPDEAYPRLNDRQSALTCLREPR